MPSVRCPGCRAVLKLKAAPPVGKRLKCPKCETRFAPAAKAQPGVEILEDDDWGDDGGDLYEPLPPSSRRRAGGGAKKRKSTGGDGLPPAVWIGLAAVVVLVLGGVGAWAVFSGGGGDAIGGGLAGGGVPDGPVLRPAVAPPFPADRLPADADTFLHLRVADVWNDPTVGAAIPPAGRVAGEAATATYGVSPADIDSVTVAGPVGASLAAFAEAAPSDPAAATAAGQRWAAEVPTLVVVVVRLNRDFDFPAVLAQREGEPLMVPAEVAGAVGTVYVPGPDLAGVPMSAATGAGFAVWQADPRTVAVGPQARIEALAAAAGSASPAASGLERSGFAGAANGSLTLAVAPDGGLLGLPSRADVLEDAPENPPPGLVEFLDGFETVRTDAAGVVVTLDLKARPQTLRFAFPARDPADAAAVGRLEEAAEVLLAGIGDLRPADPEDTSGLNLARSLVIEMVRRASVATDDGVVTLTLPAPDDLRARLEAMAGG